MPRLYVGRLNSRVGERDLRNLFEGYGRIEEILMKSGYAFVGIDDRRDADDAVYDLNGKDLLGDRVSIEFAKGFERGVGGRPLVDGGRRRAHDDDYGRGRSYGSRRSRSRSRDRGDSSGLRKEHARNKYGAPIRTKWQIRVENLSSRVSWQDLKDYVRPHGDVTYADAHRQEPGVAVICLKNKVDLDNVMKKVDGVELNGKKVRLIDETVKSKSRSRSGSRRSASRSRSRGRSRSKSKSRSRSNSRSRSRSRSGSEKEKRRSRSGSSRRSRSRSRSNSR